jgi:hypothetical protein
MASIAIVARSTDNGGLAYLARRSMRLDWVAEAAAADTFVNVREATRAALTLPGKLRAFALPVRQAA